MDARMAVDPKTQGRGPCDLFAVDGSGPVGVPIVHAPAEAVLHETGPPPSGLAECSLYGRAGVAGRG